MPSESGNSKQVLKRASLKVMQSLSRTNVNIIIHHLNKNLTD